MDVLVRKVGFAQYHLRSILHIDTLVIIASSSRGAEFNILERGCLGNLPVNTRRLNIWHSSDVNDEVTNLSKEVVLIRVLLITGQ